MRRFSILVALSAAALLLGCTAATPDLPASSVPEETARATAPNGTPPSDLLPTPAASNGQLISESDGYSLSVVLDRTTLAAGDTVTFVATFHNGTAEPIDYSVPWCGGAATVKLTVGLPVEPVGKTWTGIAQEFKDYTLIQGLGPGGVPALKPVTVDAFANPCRDGQFEAMLGPGDSVSTSIPWSAEIVAGIGALPGTVPFQVSVGYARQNSAPTREPGYTGPFGSWIPEYKMLVVTGSIDVVGGEPNLMGAGEVVDALLADATFADWLAEEPRSTWSNANLFLSTSPQASGIVPAGPSWELDLFREVNVPRHWAIAFIDPFDGSIRSVTYCDIPCDR